MSASLSSSCLSYSSRYPPPLGFHPLTIAVPPLLHFLASLVSFLLRGKGGWPHTFVNRRPRRKKTKKRSKRRRRRGHGWPGWIRKRWKKRRRWRRRRRRRRWRPRWREGVPQDRMSEESVMRSLNTNTAPTDQPTVGCKSGKGDRTRRGNERKSETKKNRSEKTTEVAERGGGGEEVQWIGGGKRLQGVLSTRKELAIGPSHRRFVSCHVRILNFQPSIQPNSRTGH